MDAQYWKKMATRLLLSAPEDEDREQWLINANSGAKILKRLSRPKAAVIRCYALCLYSLEVGAPLPVHVPWR
jgi:hypothetical protein